jgi:hypothetical protein
MRPGISATVLSARTPRRVGAVLAGLVLALGLGAIRVGSPAQAASPSPELLARSVQEPVGTKLQQGVLARSAEDWRGGPITTSTGDTVTVYVSDTYPPDQVTQQYWAEFLAHLTHGPELSTVKLYVAPFAEVSSLCGPQALGCYQDDEIVAIGEPYVDGTTPEEIVRHEYGHHIAFSRTNPPWVAVDWGPKYWASSENVCSKVSRQLAYPGNESDHYELNPGEAWAETYRLLDEQKAGITTGSWQIVSPSFYPSDAQLQAAEKDVDTPWGAAQTHRYSRVFTARTKKVWTIRLATPLDGTVGVSVLLPKRSQSTVALTTGDGRVLARGVRSGARTRRISSTVCGQRSLSVRVTPNGPPGTVSVVTTTP